MARAVVLLSGGLDSATTLAWARRRGDEVHALTVRYGQRHGVEIVEDSSLPRLEPPALPMPLDRV